MYIQIKNTLKNKFNHIHKKTLNNKLLILKIVNFIYNNSKIQVKSIISFSPLIVFFSCILSRQFILKNLISTSF